jgi:hypothetical protein
MVPMSWTPTIGTQIVAHLIGDYVLQPHWMAVQKTEKIQIAAGHALLYLVPFLIMRPSWLTMLLIVTSHFVIDHWRLSRFVVWAQNQFGPKQYRIAFPRDRTGDGLPWTMPLNVFTFLLIVTDDVLHLVANSVAFWIGN